MRNILGLVCLVGAVAASHTFESLRRIPDRWKKGGLPNPQRILKLRMAMVRSDPRALHETIMSVSTPGSPKYGQHLSYRDLNALLQPKGDVKDTVQDWLLSHGASNIHFDRDWVRWTTTVSEAEEMLNTTFRNYKSEITGASIIRTLSYSVPENLEPLVYTIQPTTRFGHHAHNDKREKSRAAPSVKHRRDQPPLNGQSPCNPSVTGIDPACLKYLYRTRGYEPKEENKTFIGVSEFTYGKASEGGASYEDLAKFEKDLAPFLDGEKFSVRRFNGYDGPFRSLSIETTADVQYAMAMSYPVPATIFSVAGKGPTIPSKGEQPINEPWLEYLEELLKLPKSKLPTTLTSSYGESEQTLPERYARQVCDMYGQLGARGVSVFFSSGNYAMGNVCESNDGMNTTKFQPHFPASCPYVTAVGATKLDQRYSFRNEGPIVEQVVGLSGGGFSDYFDRPSYQEEAVSAYREKIGNIYAPYYNHEGRGYPDIAAVGSNFAFIYENELERGTGTSLAVPTAASIFARINSALVARDRPPLGFINPWLYSKAQEASALNDINIGTSSAGCRTGPKVKPVYPNEGGFEPGAGWNTKPGWDAATGLGTPDFMELLKVALQSAD